MKTILLFLSLIILSSCGGTAENLSVGNIAPDFTLQDSQNNVYTLSDYKGKSPVVVYFYPKANTRGCTTEACGIRDDYANFKENGIVIFGISVDSKEDIKKFVEEHSLNFPLLSDESKEITTKFGALNNLGVANRITFIVDKEGKIANIIRDVNVDTHADQVYELAKKLL